jgi:hypothetical protein
MLRRTIREQSELVKIGFHGFKANILERTYYDSQIAEKNAGTIGFGGSCPLRYDGAM